MSFHEPMGPLRYHPQDLRCVILAMSCLECGACPVPHASYAHNAPPIFTSPNQCEWMPSLDPDEVPLRKRSMGTQLRQVVPHSQIPLRHFKDTDRKKPFINNST